MRLLLLALLAFAVLFLVFYHERDEGPFRVVDGDTAWGRQKYRAIYIDAPELGRPKEWHLSLVGNATCLSEVGRKAKEAVEGNLSFITYQPWRKDPYGRVLGAFNGAQLELSLVREGLAFCYYRSPSFIEDLLDPLKEECLKVEKEAMEERRGVWACAG